MKIALLLVAHGSTHPEGWEGLRFFESLCRRRFPGMMPRWAFTSSMSRQRLASQKKKSDSVYKALKRLHFEKFKAVAIQPLQTIPGAEYEELAKNVAQAIKETGLVCSLGDPLLKAVGDAPRLAQALLACPPPGRGFGEEVVFMAHGAKHEAGSLYGSLASALAGKGFWLAAMSSPPFLEDILPRLTSGKIWLAPLLSVTGVHVMRDMAGDDAASWKSRIEAAGHECHLWLRGMVQAPSVADLWLDNLELALEKIENSQFQKSARVKNQIEAV